MQSAESSQAMTRRALIGAGVTSLLTAKAVLGNDAPAQHPAEVDALPKAFIDGNAHGWRPLGEEDFVNVNGHDDTWTWRDRNVLACTGEPLGVLRTVNTYRNFELVCQWRHRTPGGNSGIFLWVSQTSIDALTGPGLPHGIEVQVLDPAYKEQVEQRTGRPVTRFTCHGDVFPVGEASMKPFPPISPNGQRSFPTKELTLPANQWNHYYVRAINGEVRLWVNGEEVSGGSDCNPADGYLCLQSEGAPIDFANIHLRELS